MAVTANDIKNYVKPEIVPVYKYRLEIDTTPAAENPTWKELCAGINNISEALNETIQQYFFLCGNGGAVNYVTGLAPAVTLTGVRVVGDDAQDYVFSKKFGLMSERDTHLRMSRTDEAGTTTYVSANITLAALSDVSGGTTDGSAINIEMRFNGLPFAGDAWAQ